MFTLKALQLLNTSETFKPWQAGNILSQYSEYANFAQKDEQGRRFYPEAMLAGKSAAPFLFSFWKSVIETIR